MTRLLLVPLVFLVLLAGSTFSQEKTETRPTACGFSKEVRDPLLNEAALKKFTVRRVEIAGNTYTRHRDFVKRMAPGLREGEVFTLAALEESVRKVSRMHAVYPITLDNVEVHLDRASEDIDIVICVTPKPKN